MARRYAAAHNDGYMTSDSFATGSTVKACLAPDTLDNFDPVLRRMLCGAQHFTKQADGRWRPQGCQLGLARCFEFSDLLLPVAR